MSRVSSDRSRRVRRQASAPATRPTTLASVIRKSLLISAGVMLAQPGFIKGVQASPEGGNVVAGQGNIQQTNANTTIVQQQSHSLAIDWQSFNLTPQDLVQFNQPSASAAVLNRVLNSTPTNIFGTIQANGQVFIMNQAGIVFGDSANVDVGSLFASRSR